MAELNLKQISDRLNEMFRGDGKEGDRRLVFWYDDRKEFTDDIDEIEPELENAKVYRLETNNQFFTKRFLEREDRTTNYLIYAPFAKPDARENHLEDTLLYSARFYADRASLVCADLGLDETLKPLISAHVSFFGNKVRERKFKELDINPKTEQNLLLGMLAVLSGAGTPTLEDVVRMVFKNGELDGNKLLAEFDKHDLLAPFWKEVQDHFGYEDQGKSLKRFMTSLFTSGAALQVQNWLSLPSREHLMAKPGTCVAFLNSMANDRRYQKRYDELSETAFKESNLASGIDDLEPDNLVECDLFIEIDRKIVGWIIERLNSEDTDAKLGGLDIPALCAKRLSLHFGMFNETVELIYRMLESAFRIVCAAGYQPPAGLNNIIGQYTKSDMLIDRAYRKFYFYYDKLNNPDSFDGLRTKVENIYTNVFLEKLLPAWNEGTRQENLTAAPRRQHRFFMNHSATLKKERTVVIISDAFRYEVGEELFRQCRGKPNWTAEEPDYLLSVLPSVTSLGMAALLPHGQIELTADCAALVDGVPCVTLDQRQSILQKAEPKSRVFQYEELRLMNKEEMREQFKGLELAYIYHNQIDARGDNAKSENEVFTACEEAVKEIYDLIHRISTNANTYHFLVTADHGFIYKRDKLAETDKIGGFGTGNAAVHRRALVSDKPIDAVGVDSKPLAEILQNDSPLYVSYPVSSNVFKTAGAGLNYVHGGSSPQEMIVPLLEVKVGRAKIDKEYAQIKLVSSSRKVTNGTLTVIPFAQTKPVSDRVQAGVYRVFFRDAKGGKISNEEFHTANSSEPEERDRNFTLKFKFKNQKYEITEEYFLVIANADGDEIERHSFKLDIPFNEDYGF